MPPFDLSPTYLTQAESERLASRQLLSFLFLPGEEKVAPGWVAPSRSLFSLQKFPTIAYRSAPQFFQWQSRSIYDVDGRKLFRDLTIDLDSEHEIRVRVAASDLLRTPVWSISAGRKWITNARVQKTLNVIRESEHLEPLPMEGETDFSLVCYNYPKLGILCRSRSFPDRQFVVDLEDARIIRVNRSDPSDSSILNIVWSPYDFVTRATIDYFKWSWQRNLAVFSPWMKRVTNVHAAMRLASETAPEQQYTNPQLVLEGQQTFYYCAAASASMILHQHGVPCTQNDVKVAMGINETGASPEAQRQAFEKLSANLAGELVPPEFERAQKEIDASRPFMTSTKAEHVRACGGYKTQGQTRMLLIYDPYPENEGSVSYEDWQIGQHRHFICVRPRLYS